MECKDCSYFEYDGELGHKRCHYPGDKYASANIKDADTCDCNDRCDDE